MRISVCRLDEHPESESPLRLPMDAGGSLASNHPAIRNGKYLWSIIEGVISGIAETKREVERIAEQYGLEVDFHIRCDNNEDFINHVRHRSSKAPVVSYIKRQSGKYTLAAWHNRIDYLSVMEPFAFEDHYSEATLQAAAIAYGGPKSPFVGYRADGTPVMLFGSHAITNYIRRKEAERKFSTPSTSTTAGKIEFVYANHNEGVTHRTNWQRHRIIKTTDQTIFVDRYPFCGTSYLRSGWRAMVVYANMLDRESMEQELCFYHRDRKIHFYTERKAKRKCRRFFVKGGVFSDDVLELPPDGVGWALKLLGIAQWPATVEAIKKAFARSAMKHHPDRGGTHHMFISCMAAREFLMDQIAA